METNIDIRRYARRNEVFLYEIGQRIGVSEVTITRWLRNPTPEQQQKMIKAIDEIAAEKAGN